MDGNAMIDRWMGWNGMEWNGMEWNGMEWNGMGWNGLDWNRMDGMDGLWCRHRFRHRFRRCTDEWIDGMDQSIAELVDGWIDRQDYGIMDEG